MQTLFLIVDRRVLSGRALALLVGDSLNVKSSVIVPDTDLVERVTASAPGVILLNVHTDTLNLDIHDCLRLADLPEDYMIGGCVPQSVMENSVSVVGLFEAGADGLLDWDTLSVDDFRDVLLKLADKQPLWNSREVRRAMLERDTTKIQAEYQSRLLDMLTPREHEVFILLTQGASNSAIAEQLSLSERTVQGYIGKILEKLGMNSRFEAVVTYLHERLQPSETAADENSGK